MKAKLLTLLLALLFTAPVNIFSSTDKSRKRSRKFIRLHQRTILRTPFEYGLSVGDTNDYLLLTFHFPAKDAEISITDKNGEIVFNEKETFIYQGQTISFMETDAYPYSVKIISSFLEIEGEIVLEE